MAARDADGRPWMGAHVSIAGGLAQAVERARSIGATAMQMFTGWPQRWAERELTESEADAFREALRASPVRVAGAHDSYLINLASEDSDLFRKSCRAFRSELGRCVALGLDFLVTHPGNATGGDRDAALRRNARAVAEALGGTPGGTRVLFETTAGSGTALGWRFEELGRLVEAVPAPERDRVGVCLDSCHVFAAGYDLRTEYGDVMNAFDREIGLDRLDLLHLNDSRRPLGSRKDRHAHVGEGELGREGFAGLMADDRLRHVPRVIETPKGDDAAARDRENLERLRELDPR